MTPLAEIQRIAVHTNNRSQWMPENLDSCLRGNDGYLWKPLQFYDECNGIFIGVSPKSNGESKKTG
ncbi:MAG: hypothetical protein LBU43_12395 [Candidatus Accumulibacter sp.]|jgi:hypothetical protein|nr:hypothetical protein [Accumulibacter sp.]